MTFSTLECKVQTLRLLSKDLLLEATSVPVSGTWRCGVTVEIPGVFASRTFCGIGMDAYTDMCQLLDQILLSSQRARAYRRQYFSRISVGII